MYAEVKLMDPHGEERTVPMLAHAATPIRFKQLFNTDILTGIVAADGTFDTEVVGKLAFIMAMAAVKVDMTTLSEEKYIEWLEGFDSATFIENAQAVFNVYIRSKSNSSKAKK